MPGNLPEPTPPGNLPYDTTMTHAALPGYGEPDVLTVMKAPGRRLTKLMTPYDKLGVEHTSRYLHRAEQVVDLEDLDILLDELAEEWDAMVIRGAILEGRPPVCSNIHRSKRKGRSLIDAARSWFFVDIDESAGIELPPDWLQSGEATARMIVRQALPPEFHEAGMILQWSSGQRPDATIASAHLWFWLSRPLFSWEALDWMSLHELIDLHPYQPHQPHYIADPRWIDITSDGEEIDAPDPLAPHRKLYMPGPAVAVPEVIEPKPSTAARRQLEGGTGGLGDWRAYLALVGDGEERLGLHNAIRGLALSYVNATYPQHDREFLRALVKRQPVRRGRPAEELEDRYGPDFDKSFDEAVAIVEGEQVPETLSDEALAKFGAGITKTEGGPNSWLARAKKMLKRR